MKKYSPTVSAAEALDAKRRALSYALSAPLRPGELSARWRVRVLAGPVAVRNVKR